MLKKKIYAWHRRLSLLIAIPVILSAASGLMHPIMTNIRPAVATQGLNAIAINADKIQMPLETALLQNGVDSFHSVRLVHIDTNWFYQVQRTEESVPKYFSTETGKALPQGDWLYAQYLARQFLEGQESKHVAKNATKSVEQSNTAELPDCCSAAYKTVRNAKGAPIASVRDVTHFDEEYTNINRLLPVYKVQFDRSDGIRIYVETTQDRFAFAMDNRRARFNKIFQFVHAWSWLDFLGKGRLVFEFLLYGLAFVTSILGVYIFFATRSKKVPGNNYVKSRRTHRYTAITASLFTLMFTFSGSYHAIYKLKEDDRNQYFSRECFATTDIHFDLSTLQKSIEKPIANIGMVRMDGHNYWCITTTPIYNPKSNHKDLMKDARSVLPETIYIDISTNTLLPNGEARYAAYLATLFSGNAASQVKSVEPITRFNNEYNFTDKRLPVWKVTFSNTNTLYFIETSTSRLSVKVDKTDLIEGYSFALLHKHEFLGWAGKSVKDFSTMFWAAAQIVMVTIGLMLYFKWRKRQQ